MLSREARDELRAINEEEFDEVLTEEEVEAMGVRVLRFFSILLGDGKDTSED